MSNLILELKFDPILFESQGEAYKAFDNTIRVLLKEYRLDYKNIEIYLDSQHFFLIVDKVPSIQHQKIELIRGPQKNLATTRCGKRNFMYKKFEEQKKGKDGYVTIKTENNNQYFYVEKKLECKRINEIIPSICSRLVKEVPLTYKFPLIIKSIYASYDGEPIKVELNGLKNESAIPETSKKYIERAKEHIDLEAKKQQLLFQINKSLGDNCYPYSDKLLKKSLFYTNNPNLYLGRFDQVFLDLPVEIITEALKYNPNVILLKQDGKLTNRYGILLKVSSLLDATIENIIIEINKKIQKAYKIYSDDIEKDFAKNTEELKNLVFIEDLGTMYDKVQRVKHISLTIVDLLEIGEPISTFTVKGAELCKNDLLTKMVSVHPSLHGEIGKHYSLLWDEEPEVAQGIQEYLYPQKKEDQLPQTMVGSILSIADKLDTIVGCFSSDHGPPESSDPFRIKNKTDAVIKITYQSHMNISLKRLINLSIALYESFHILRQKDKDTLLLKIMSYFNRRFKLLLARKGFNEGVIKSITSNKNTNLTLNYEKAEFLQTKLNSDDIKVAVRIYNRVNNILLNDNIEKIELEFLKDEAEKKLFENLTYCKNQYYDNIEKGELEQAFNQLLNLQESIEKMFNQTYILTDDVAVKKNRLALLGAVKELYLDFCDFSKL
ncbi:glycine--tRNA ligase subunit beta [Proteinivorax tanatarense]|uniref:glycine--tRNA ligase n=1 Tax=Proteinivorax tanatarense TaxID=1260629 RepID=A0AAU7VI74_9FIRM